jgi:hypothetical protein
VLFGWFTLPQFPGTVLARSGSGPLFQVATRCRRWILSDPLMILQPENGILSYTGRGFREGDNDAATKGVNRRTVMSGRERISDKDIAEWIKEVEDDTSPKEVASNPSRKNRRPIGMTKATIDPATRRLTARVLYRPPTNVSPRMRARRHPFVDCLSCVGGLLILARGLWLLGSRLLTLIRRLCGLRP